MNSTKIKALVIVSALLLMTSIITVGCRSKSQGEMVNTDSLPGKTFSHYTKKTTQQSTSRVVYLGSEKDNSGVNFGPNDVSFDFKGLR